MKLKKIEKVTILKITFDDRYEGESVIHKVYLTEKKAAENEKMYLGWAANPSYGTKSVEKLVLDVDPKAWKTMS